ncbi:spore-associated protein A [Streptosporangium sp. NPDC005286]|uniref:spore-associated protein A n=1 Tax=unclassified Streptosporangium TaxID=2632669 RepID=UPI0033AF1E42
MRTFTKIAATGLAAIAMTAGTLATAAPASAATYGGQCGSGYSVVNQRTITGKGTVFLTYNSANGNNCVVTIRNTPGTAVSMFAGIARQSDPAWGAVDEGNYTTYAGPVYRYAKGSCVTWGGAISGTYAGGEDTNCG